MKQRTPRTTDERLRWTAQLLTAMNKQRGFPPDANRLDVHKTLQEAFASEWEVKTIEINGKPEEMINAAGIFGLIFVNDRVDYKDPATQERISRIVDDAISHCLNDPSCVMRSPQRTTNL